jgi:hypothetical protein
MSYFNSPRIITDGLVLCLDVGNTKSYPGSGTTWTDISRNSNNGTLSGPTFSSTNGGVLSFDGTNDSVSVSRNVILEPQTISVSWWVKGQGNQGNYKNTGLGKFYDASWASWDSNTDTYSNSNIKCYVYNGTTAGTVIVPSVLDNTWHNICWTYTSPTIIAYKDGIRVGSASVTGPIVYNSGNLSIGAYNAGLFFSGQHASTLMYSRALTPSEVLQNFNATRGRFNI